jgi:4-amino-4-deoxy-L-arabinose transferase-like glycosyltransferase
LLLVTILAGTLLLNLANNDFPLHYHADEPKKVGLILDGRETFTHPLLLLQVTRLANMVAHRTDPQEIVVLGRGVSAVFGALIVLAVYIMAHALVGPTGSLIIAVGVALTPLVAVHAHYLKEDIYVTPACIAALWFLNRLISRRDWLSTCGLGLLTGLAISAKYIGVLLLIIYLAAPMICHLEDFAGYYRRLILALGPAVLIFLLVNYPLIYDFDGFRRGLAYEVTHVRTGHDLRIKPLPHFFSFHLLNSVIPGITWMLAVPAFVFMGQVLVWWRQTSWHNRLLL